VSAPARTPVRHILAAAAAAILAATPAAAEDPLLNEAVAFTGQIFHLYSGVPGLIIAAVRGRESAVFGFGEVTKGSGRDPDGETQIGIGSITKTFTGLALAHAVAGGTVALANPVDRMSRSLRPFPNAMVTRSAL
jgi:serine-type D-Ala-D-Ala carboxypeptidase/endopeptidase